MTPATVSRRASLRLRIALAVTVVALTVSAAVGTVLARQAANEAREALREQALARLASAADGYRIDGRLRMNASVDPNYPPPPLRQAVAGQGQATYYDERWMWASERLGKGVVITVRLDGRPLMARDAGRVRALIVAGLVCVLLSSTLGWGVATTLSRRLRRAAAASRDIAEGRSSAHIHEGGSDEVAALTGAVDAMADALRERLAVERAFTADVAHELRTPLTGLVSAVELLPPGEVPDLVRLQVDRLRRLVEDLLEVSRLDHATDDVALAPVDLAQAAREALERVGHDATVAFEVERSCEVLLDRRRFDRIIANLVGNLRRHGGGSGVLRVIGETVELRDHGPGYPSEVLEGGPRRFHGVGRTKGSGLGLTIVLGQAHSMGVTVLFTNHPDGGAVTRLSAPPAPQHQLLGGSS